MSVCRRRTAPLNALPWSPLLLAPVHLAVLYCSVADSQRGVHVQHICSTRGERSAAVLEERPSGVPWCARCWSELPSKANAHQQAHGQARTPRPAPTVLMPRTLCRQVELVAAVAAVGRPPLDSQQPAAGGGAALHAPHVRACTGGLRGWADGQRRRQRRQRRARSWPVARQSCQAELHLPRMCA